MMRDCATLMRLGMASLVGAMVMQRFGHSDFAWGALIGMSIGFNLLAVRLKTH